jgi:hypothetical protein
MNEKNLQEMIVMPYNHHHSGPNLPDPIRNARVVYPHPDKPNHAYLVRWDSIQKPNQSFLVDLVPLNQCKLHLLSDESLHRIINQLMDGTGLVNWAEYQAEMDAANRYHRWAKQWGTVIEVDGAYWGWTGTGSSSVMGAIPVDPTEDWELTPEEGPTLADYGLYGFIDTEEKIEKLKEAIRSYC